jgi:hypothetical protein
LDAASEQIKTIPGRDDNGRARVDGGSIGIRRRARHGRCLVEDSGNRLRAQNAPDMARCKLIAAEIPQTQIVASSASVGSGRCRLPFKRGNSNRQERPTAAALQREYGTPLRLEPRRDAFPVLVDKILVAVEGIGVRMILRGARNRCQSEIRHQIIRR